MSITNQENKERIIVFTGPMFSGKTTALIKKHDELIQQNKTVLVLKPAIDDRYSQNAIVSHDKNTVTAVNINNLEDARELIHKSEYIFLDEAQFLPRDTVNNVLSWKAKGKSFVIAGLDMDYLSNPFGIIPDIINIADEVVFLNGVCDICNNPSTNTFRKNTNKKLILIGEKTEYAGLCKTCFLQNTKQI